MARKSFAVQLLWPFVTLLLLALVLNTWGALRSMQRFDLEQTMDSLEIQARLVIHALGRLDGNYSPGRVDALCKELGQATGTRITVILPSGEVVGDSVEPLNLLDNHGDRPEVRDAMTGIVGSSSRFSHTLQANLVYVAVPVMADGKAALVVRASKSLAAVQDTVRHAWWTTLLLCGALAVAAVAAGIGLARLISSPVELMRRGAEQFARGDFEGRVAVPDSMELAELAMALNQMAAQLRERIETVSRQRNELNAILSSMTEGVIAVGRDERILTVNATARRWFGLEEEGQLDGTLQEIIRKPRIHQCAVRMLADTGPFEDEFSLPGMLERQVRLSASPLHDGAGKKIGALLVLSDVTQLRRLEQMRSEFVANVSHEIRTPLTAIRGYAETLLHDTEIAPETARRFLEIMVRHAERLSALVEDILTLAGLEGAQADRNAAMSELLLDTVIDAAMEACLPMAGSKQVVLDKRTEPDVRVRGNAMLLEQAVANLLDNAIKYSDAGAQVVVESVRIPSGVAVRVRDTGEGIAAEHHGRVFERFYRVDRARSRAQGGTGLGLSIVKHIAVLHQGEVTLESAPGQGSTFSILLPVAEELTEI